MLLNHGGWVPLSTLIGMLCCGLVDQSATPSSASFTSAGDWRFANVNADQESESPLVSAKELKAMLGRKDLVILDLGPERESYATGHIPGAQFVDWVDDITDLNEPDRYKLVGKSDMQKLLRRLGVTDQSRIVIYDDMDSRVAVRMYWSLKYYGLEKIQILNGGRPAWTSAGLPLSKDVVAAVASEFEIGTVSSVMSVNLDYVADRLQDPAVNLIDGRPVDQYTGKAPGKVFHTGALHQRKGHIPGAINIFWKDNFNADGTFKSKAELEKLYESVTGSDTIVTYCNEGLHAVPPWFVLSELLGHGNVRVYDDSMSEWANSSQPMESGNDK